jgi:hypothetical protein
MTNQFIIICIINIDYEIEIIFFSSKSKASDECVGLVLKTLWV